MADLFNNGRVRVHKNPNNEIFVTDVKTGAEMRIDSNGQGLGFTAFGFDVRPTVVAGSIGYEVLPRR